MKNKIRGLFLCATLAAFCQCQAWANAPKGSLEEAWKLFEDSQNIQSLTLCKKLLMEFPDNPRITPQILLLQSLNYDHLSNASQSRADAENARTSALRITTEYPSSDEAAEAYFYLGEMYSGNVPVKLEKNCEKAVAYYTEAIKRSKKTWINREAEQGLISCKVSPLSDSAMALVDVMEYGLALPIYKKIEADYRDTEQGRTALMMIGICYDGMGKQKDAIKTYEEYLRRYKTDTVAVYYYYAAALNKSKQFQKAREMLEKIVNANSGPEWAVKAAKAELEKPKKQK